MEIKDNLLGSKNLLAREKKTDDSALKRKINNYLIIHFTYLIIVLSFIILFAGLFLFSYPQYKGISNNEETARKNLQIEYEAKNNYLNKINNLGQIYKQISEADRKKIKAMVPADNKIINLIPEVESIILRNSAALESIKIDLEEAQYRQEAAKEIGIGKGQKSLAGIFAGRLPEGVELVRIEIELSEVNYQILKNIIVTFENSLRLFDVAKINYGFSENKVNLVVYTYYLSN